MQNQTVGIAVFVNFFLNIFLLSTFLKAVLNSFCNIKHIKKKLDFVCSFIICAIHARLTGRA